MQGARSHDWKKTVELPLASLYFSLDHSRFELTQCDVYCIFKKKNTLKLTFDLQ